MYNHRADWETSTIIQLHSKSCVFLTKANGEVQAKQRSAETQTVSGCRNDDRLRRESAFSFIIHEGFLSEIMEQKKWKQVLLSLPFTSPNDARDQLRNYKVMNAAQSAKQPPSTPFVATRGRGAELRFPKLKLRGAENFTFFPRSSAFGWKVFSLFFRQRKAQFVFTAIRELFLIKLLM